MSYMYVAHVSLVCLPDMYGLCVWSTCLSQMSASYVLHVCPSCLPLCVLHVCRTCQPGMPAWHVWPCVQVNHCIRKITPDGEVVTVAGTPQVCVYVCLSVCLCVCASDVHAHKAYASGAQRRLTSQKAHNNTYI